MTTNNKKQFLRKKLPVYIGMASGLSLMVGAASMPAVAQDSKNADQVEEVIVTGQRASIQSAQDIKRNASTIVDSLVAEDIGKLPDRSVTEALQRVPGVSVGRYTNNDAEHPAAEGSGVAIRGLTQVRAELNGRDVFSAASGRGLSFEDVPAELMYAVDTYKSPSADMIEGGLGGTVNLRTRMPFDSDEQLISVSAKANYGDQLKETNGEYSGLYSNRWETAVGEFGVLINASTSDLASRSDQVYTRPYLPRTIDGDDVWVSKGVDWRRNDYQSTREGAYLALQWAPNDQAEVYFTAFRSKHDTTYDENAFFLEGGNGDQALVPTADNDWVYSDNGAMRSGTVTVANPADWGLDFGTSTRWANNVSKTTDYSTGVKWSPDDHWKFSADFQYVKAEAKVDDYTLGLKVIPAEAYMDGMGSETPTILIDPQYMADYSNYSLGQQMTHFERNNAEAKTARFDAEYDFEGAVVKSIKAGVRYSEKEADNINTGYDWNTRYATWFNGYDKNTLPKVTEGQAEEYLALYKFSDFQRGDVTVPAAGYLYSAAAVKNFRATTDAINSTCPDEPFSWACDSQVYIEWNRLSNPDYRNLQSEKSMAMYMMANYGFDDLALPIDGNLGVRVVQTDNTASGTLVVNEGKVGDVVVVPRITQPLEAKVSDTHVLPSFNLRMRATDDVYIRFAASKAIWAPSFSDMQAFVTVDPNIDQETGIIRAYNLNQDTNPYLKPMEATQFDLSIEWYFDDLGGMVYAALFNKQVEGFFKKKTAPYAIGDFSGTATWLDNVGSGDINGLEIGINKFFDTLPAPFDGLGIQANYTYIDSKADVSLPNSNGTSGAAPVDTDGSAYGQLPVDQLSKNAFNLVGMYEKDGFSARLAYSWRSKYLIAWGGNGFNPDFPDWSGKASIPVYNDDYGQLDASISYTFLDNYTITAEATNLLKEKTIGIMDQNGAGDNIAYSYAQDARFAVGLRARF
ncbi:TonB-dependent receptor [Cellvibrio japonicus]|uniref:TonB-dependent receptor n=1 Tax=Cellvibrio japonicus (strain Ueda107) TaxID=498211 RepID=B3PBE2_CELJU|nr:TonB-dependent receptor [Cellvibrio japonicus]ACE82825.1 TonB-dependent receptor [Cellvibrio japonicus Ueda107]QEI13066.1 TonB-dependent receptor [Cellvibrio japonicus]QEI16640.1 TonB-dependent receptor [Cellvibrio japonicus]QEI20218.1 TonB-dependent receptor [Cellvibrio japonicus]